MPSTAMKRKHDAVQKTSDQVPHKKRIANGHTIEKRSAEHKPDVQTKAQLETAYAKHPQATTTEPVYVQIVAGSYDRVLHGITAKIGVDQLAPDKNAHESDTNGQDAQEKAIFTDTFLFEAHTASIRCLALSPPTGGTNNNKRYLATGSADERINLYTLSTTPPKSASPKSKSSLLPVSSQNPLNRTLGSLTHHSRPLTTLHFPSRAKLFSAAEDNVVAITRTRDWTTLSDIRAPVPKPVGRPSGDTALPGDVPAGINSLAVHPSQKLMLTVGRGERCMRLWNLMTGKKAGVLQFERETLALAGEGKWSSGEGRKVLWQEDGEGFVVGFEKGAVAFGVDSRARAVLRPREEGCKVHQMRFLPGRDVLAAGTEDGRVLLWRVEAVQEESDGKALPKILPFAEMGGREVGIASRVKDFQVLQVPQMTDVLLLITGHSDGAIRLWTLSRDQLTADSGDSKRVGTLIGTAETGNRITCLGAFVMDSPGAISNVTAEDFIDGIPGEDESGSDEAEEEGEAEEDEEEFDGFD